MDPSTQSPPPVKPRLHRAPLVIPALAAVLGIIAGRYIPLPGGFWVIVGLAALGAAGVFYFRSHLHQACGVAVAAAVLAFFAAYVQWSYFTVRPDDIVNFTADAPSLATLDGQIVTSPQIVADDPDVPLQYKRDPHTAFLLKCDSIQSRQGPRPAGGLVRVTVDEPAANLSAGQRVQVVCTMGRFAPPRNPGQFDQAASARENHTLVWATVRTADGVTVLDEPRGTVGRAYWRLRAATRQHLDSMGDPADGHLVNALIIGERHPALESLNRAMMKAGVAHYLSISGTHMMIFLGFFYLLCRLLTLTTRQSAAAVLIALVSYMLLATPSPPLLRSAIMAGAVALAALTGRRSSTLNALAGAAILLLLADPLDLFSAGFQLSFGIVLGLVLLTGPMRDRIFGRFLRRRGLTVFRHDERFRRWVNFKLADWGMSAAAVSLSAFVVSAPLAAYHFGMFSPYAGLLTLVLALPVTMVLVCGYISMALLGLTPNLSQAFGDIAAWSAGLLEKCVQWSQALPGLCLPMRPVSVPWVLLCYVFIAAVMLRRRIPLGRVLIACMAVALTAWTVYSQRQAPAPARTEIHVMAVGPGQCVLLHTPEGKTYIFDAGTRGSFDAYRTVLAPFIRIERLPAPEAVFVSHANADHYNALIGLLPASPPRTIYLSPYFAPGPAPDLSLARLLQEIDRQHVPITRVHAGDEFALDSHVRVQVLWPDKQAIDRATSRPGKAGKLDINDTSLVLRVTCDGTSILIPGDAAKLAEEELIKNPKALKSDVLILPHHGSINPLPDRFVRCVDPRVVVISNSHDPCPPDLTKPTTKPATTESATTKSAKPAKLTPGEFYYHLRQERQCYSTWKDGCTVIRLGYGSVEVQQER